MEKQQSKLTNQMQAILKCHQVWRIWLFSLVLHFSAMGQATWNQLYLNLKWVGCVHVTLFQWWSPSYSEQIAVCLYCLCKRPIKHFICIRVKSKRTVHTASYRGYRLVVDNLRVAPLCWLCMTRHVCSHARLLCSCTQLVSEKVHQKCKGTCARLLRVGSGGWRVLSLSSSVWSCEDGWTTVMSQWLWLPCLIKHSFISCVCWYVQFM